jgi:beta-N-acetylhexosaminidase
MENDSTLPRALAAVALAGVVALQALAGAARAADDERVDVRGRVASVTPASAEAARAGRLGVILVEGAKEDDTSYDKASVTIRSDTRLVAADGRPARFEDIAVGTAVEAGFEGPVAESYPVQAGAAWVRALAP